MTATMKTFWESTYRSSTGLASSTPTTRAPLRENTNQYLQWRNEEEDELQDVATVDEVVLFISDRYIDSSSCKQ